MRITLATEDGSATTIEVGQDETVENVKALIEVEMGIPVNSQLLTHNGQAVPDAGNMASTGINENDLIFIAVKPNAPSQVPGSANASLNDVIISLGPSPTPEMLLQTIAPNDRLMRELRHYNPDLAESLSSGDVVKIRTTIMMQELSQHKIKYEREQEDRALMDNPFDEEAQKRIEERIRKENVEQNMKLAMEEMPEAFSRVFMLYIKVEVNGHKLKAFVDSGAQMTIMNQACAEKTGMMRLLDTRFQGMARGVGTAKILGKVHMAQLKIGNSFFGCSFTVMESQGVDLLFGLDMLRRHQCCIDLARGALRIGSAGEEVSFLAEHELPEEAQEGKEFEPAEEKRGGDESKGGSKEDSKMDDPSSGGGAAAGGAASHPGGGLGGGGAGGGGGGGDGGGGGGVPTEALVAGLVALGFPEARARAALAQCGGDPELAATLLFADGGGPGP